jgi:hypothetical protein
MISHLLLFVKSSIAGKLAIACFVTIPIWATIAAFEIFSNHADAWIQSVPITIVAITGFIAMLRGQKNMHLQMNSRLDELIEAKRGVAEAKGVEKERSEERQRKTASRRGK